MWAWRVRSISFGMTQSPSGCNPHTTAGDTPATQLVLNAVLPEPVRRGRARDWPRANANLIEQAEVVEHQARRRSSTR